MTDRFDATCLKGYITWEEMARVADRYGRVAVWSLYMPDQGELMDTLELLQEEAMQHGLLVHDEPKDKGDVVFVATRPKEVTL